jgi:hypothetical protein
VTFLPQFLGAFPRALSPLGALPYLGVRAGEGYVRRGLVHEHQPRGVHAPQALLERDLRFFVSLGGTQRLFCSSTPAYSIWLGSWPRRTP